MEQSYGFHGNIEPVLRILKFLYQKWGKKTEIDANIEPVCTKNSYFLVKSVSKKIDAT